MKIIVTVFLLSLGSVLWSQNNILSGMVADNNEVVPFAKVWLKHTDFYTSTNLKGEFEISNIPNGTYNLQITASSHSKYQLVVTFKDASIVKNITLEKIDLELDQVVVTGAMREVSISKSPVKIELITSEFFKSNPVNSVIEALETVNGVQEQINCGVCGTNDIHINGMEGPYTLVLIDGMPIVSGLSSAYGFNGIPTSLIERVEIIKGPSSTLYGTEAVGGIINIITKSPETSSLIEFESNSNTHEEYKTSLAWSPKVGKRVFTTISADYLYNQKRLDFNNDNFTDIPLNNRISIFNKWEIKNKKKEKVLNLAARYYGEDRFGGTLEWNDSFLGSDSIYGEHVSTSRVELIGDYILPIKNRNFTLSFSANSHDQNSHYGNVNYRASQQVFFTNFIWNKQLGKRNQFLAGYTNNLQFYKDNSSSNITEQTFVPGVFVQDEFNWTEDLILLTGVRFDYHNKHGLIVSPRISLKKDFGSYTAFRFNYGNGFRQVHLFTEDHAFLTGARQVLIKNELQPERSHNVTLNFNHTYTKLGYGNFDFDVFYTYFLNKIIPDYNTDPNLIIYDNLDGNGITRGLSLSVNHKFKVPFRMRLGITLQDVFEQSKNEVGELVKETQLFAPFFSGVFNLSYEFKKWKTKLNYTGKIVGPQKLPVYEAPNQRPEVSPWFTVQNVQLSKEFKKGWEVYTGIKNIFNYTQSSPLVNPENPYDATFDTSYAYGPLQTRRFYAGVRYNLKRKSKKLKAK
jgi:outer membrane receptor for ferrienterochelin and colicins